MPMLVCLCSAMAKGLQPWWYVDVQWACSRTVVLETHAAALGGRIEWWSTCILAIVVVLSMLSAWADSFANGCYTAVSRPQTYVCTVLVGRFEEVLEVTSADIAVLHRNRWTTVLGVLTWCIGV